MKTILAAGHICLDITPILEGHNAESITDVLVPGRLVQAGEAAIHLGGSVAKTGLAIKKLGGNVRLLGKVGPDQFGQMVKNLVEKEGGSGIITDDGSSTSYTIVLAIPGLDRMFLHHPGANDTFSAADIRQADVSDAVLFHFGYPPLMKRMYQDGGHELHEMLKMMHEQGIATSLDLAAVDPVSPAGQVNWSDLLSLVLPEVDFFVPSFEELCYMLDPEKWREISANPEAVLSLDLKREALPLAEKALSLGCAAVLLKCGTAGMALVTADPVRIQKIGKALGLNTTEWAEKHLLQGCFPAETLKSATGAGDASIAAFLVAVTCGRPPERALQIAAAEGACAVTTYDALSGLLSLSQLEEKIDAGWIRK